MSWDEFQIVGELQEQNQNLLLQLDAKERELREVQIYLSKIQHLQISSREIASWKEKYSDATRRNAEVQTKADALKSERDKLLRVLQKEVGEEVSLAKIVEDGSDWRGRAQQIILLKNKVKELKRELGGPDGTRGHELQYRKNLQKLEDTKRREKDALAKELTTTTEEYRSLRMKYEANQSRKKIIESENRDLRQKLGVLLTKTQNDDKLIDALKRELQFFREKAENAEVEKRTPTKHNKRVVTILGQDSTLKQQQEQILRQEKIIVALTNRLRTSEGLAGH